MRSMSCSAWSIRKLAPKVTRSALSRACGPRDVRESTEKSNTADAMRQLAGVYIHFPYCLAKCPYCDFASYGVERQAIDHAGYADAVLRELDARAPQLEGRSIESVFFGGGTPSL